MANNIDFQILQGDQNIEVEIEAGGLNTDVAVMQDNAPDVVVEAEDVETKPVDIEVWQDDTQIVQVQIEVGIGANAYIFYGDTLTGTGTVRDPVNIAPDIMNTIDNSVQEITSTGNIVVERTGNSITITDTTFVFDMAVAQTEWIIQHNLNKHPSVTIVDSAGTVGTCEVQFIDNNTCKIITNHAFKGVAYLN